MPRIIGKDEKLAKQVTCHGCASILEYYPNEKQERTYKDISQCTETIHYIVCPGCNKEVIIKRN